MSSRTHAVRSPDGARLLTIFRAGGFGQYLEELIVLTEAQYADGGFMRALLERYDVFES